MTKTRVIDISHWNKWRYPQRAWDMGARGVIVRLGSINNVTGECYEDYELRNYLELLADDGRFAVAGYWFWRLNHSAVKQADYIAELVQMAERGFDSQINIVAVDDEITSQFNIANTADACRETEHAAGVQAVIYSNPNVWLYYRFGDKTVMLPYDHWIAQWGVTEPDPWQPYAALPVLPVLHQYSANGNGMGAEYGNDPALGGADAMDLNWFYGTEGELHDYFGSAIVTPPPVPPMVGAFLQVANADASTLALRRSGSITSPALAYMPNGERLRLLDLGSPLRTGEVWARVMREDGLQGWAAWYYGGRSKLQVVNGSSND